MALQSIRSLAAAQKLVQSLDSSTFMRIRLQITDLVAEENFSWFVLAGYAQFLEVQANRCYIPIEAPRWWDTSYELAGFLTNSFMVARNCETQDLKTLFNMRSLALKKFLKPILSPDPTVGLPHLAPGIRAQELENPSPTYNYIAIAGLFISVLYQSFQYEPDPALKKIFEASEALEISLLVWYYAPEASVRTIAAPILLNILDKTDNHASALSRCLRYLSAGKIAEKCKEMLRDDPEVCAMDLTLHLNLANIMCNPHDPGSRLDIAYAEKNLQKVIMEVAVNEMNKTFIIWGRMQHAGHLLQKILAVDSTDTKMVTEYIEELCVLNMLALVLVDAFEHDWAKAESKSFVGFVEPGGNSGMTEAELWSVSNQASCA